MAFDLVQRLNFGKVDYSYDRRGDVLDISFGPPAPAVAIQVEDWLAIQMGLQPPFLQGMSIVGFKRIFEKINRYAEKELPKRMKKLANARLEISHDDDTDTLIMRWEEEPSGLGKLVKNLFSYKRQKPSIFEPLSKSGSLDDPLRNVYVQKSLPSKEIVGLKIFEFTKCGPTALEAIFGAIIDTIFEPSAEHDENAHLITNALIQRLDWQRVATLAA